MMQTIPVFPEFKYKILLSSGDTLLYVSLGLIGLAILAAVIFAILHKRKQNKHLRKRSAVLGRHSFRSCPPDQIAIARFTVIFSDDQSLVGVQFLIWKPLTTFGRKETNDVFFPGDHPVSRLHAQMELCKGQFLLSEIISERRGSIRPPIYGTFVNDVRLKPGEVKSISDGDVIRLGTRLRLRFTPILKSDSVTGFGNECDDSGDSPTQDLTNLA